MSIPQTSCDDVEFWDGAVYSRDELDAYLPGLGDYASTHAYLAERVPYDVKRELMGLIGWTAVGIVLFAVCLLAGLFGAPGMRDLVAMSACFVVLLTIAFGSRFIWSACEASRLPTICAKNGCIEVWCRKPARKEEELVWSAPIANVEWRLGSAWKATRPAFRFFQRYRHIVLLKGPPLSWTNVKKRGFRKENELFGCGWTAETQAMWLALFRIVESHGSEPNDSQ
jgi:hypothetical protein